MTLGVESVRDEFSGAEIHQAWRKEMQDCIANIELENPVLSQAARSYHSNVIAVRSSRRFFSTRGGLVGMGHKGIEEEGDSIAIFLWSEYSSHHSIRGRGRTGLLAYSAKLASMGSCNYGEIFDSRTFDMETIGRPEVIISV